MAELSTTNGSSIRVLAIDGHPLSRFAFVTLIEKQPCFEVCGSVGTAKAARCECETRKPDLVLMDLDIPDSEGLQLLYDLRRLHPSVRCIVAAERSDPSVIRRAFAAGAKAYSLKSEGPSAIARSLHEVSQGRVFTSDGVTSILVQDSTTRDKLRLPLDVLSARELQVFASFGRGNGVSAVAQLLSISVKTVETHQKRIREKLRVKDAAALHVLATKWNSDCRRAAPC